MSCVRKSKFGVYVVNRYAEWVSVFNNAIYIGDAFSMTAIADSGLIVKLQDLRRVIDYLLMFFITGILLVLFHGDWILHQKARQENPPQASYCDQHPFSKSKET